MNIDLVIRSALSGRKIGFIATMAAVLGCFSLGFSQGKTIFVVQSYHAEYQWDADYRAGLETVIPKGNSTVYFEMDTKRLPASEHPKMADKAYEKISELKPDVVVLGDDAALKLVGPKLAGSKTPVVYLGINNNPRNYFTDLPVNMTGILERPLLKRSLAVSKELIPSSKKTLILFDDNITSTITKKETFSDKSNLVIDGLEIDIVLVSTIDNWKDLVTSSKGKYDFVMVGLYQTIKDGSGKVMNAEDVIKWTSLNTPVPIFGFWDFSIGSDKSIGGYVLAGKNMGVRAGKMVVEILKGTDVTTIKPVVESEGIFFYSKEQLSKWKLTPTSEMLANIQYSK